MFGSADVLGVTDSCNTLASQPPCRMGKLMQLKVLIIGMRGTGVEIGECHAAAIVPGRKARETPPRQTFCTPCAQPRT